MKAAKEIPWVKSRESKGCSQEEWSMGSMEISLWMQWSMVMQWYLEHICKGTKTCPKE